MGSIGAGHRDVRGVRRGMTSAVLDAGALIALERRDVRMLALADELLAHRSVGYIPAGVIAQVWRGSPRQHPIVRLLAAQAMRVDAMTEETALRVGMLLAASSTSDVVDGHVALLARRLNAPVITSDPEDIAVLDGSLRIQRL
jgi:predicted nucleic acid-binding protein